MKRNIAMALLAGAAMWSASARAEVSGPNDIWYSWDANRLIALAAELGDTGTLVTDVPDEPASVGITTSTGLKYVIEPTACENGVCYGFLITAEFDGAVTTDQMNTFNIARAFTKSYSDSGGSYLTRYEINDYGIPKGNVAADMTNFEAVAKTYENFLSTGQIDDSK